MNQFELLDRQTEVDNAPKRFEDTYKNAKYGDRSNIIKLLNKLQKPISSDGVDNIIGNTSWTRFDCDICGENKSHLVDIQPKAYCEYENPGISICKSCLGKANKLIGETSE